MQRKTLKELVKLNIEHRRKKRWHRALSVLSAVVVFVTTYALILPAITMEKEYVCGMSEHAHTDACWYTPVPETVDTLCNFEPHSHTLSCYDLENNLLCGYADFAVHTHDSMCFDENGTITCSLKELEEHIHDDSCFSESTEYGCGLEEGVGEHIHNDSCYGDSELICSLEENEEHSHADECYGESPLICGLEETVGHVHSEDCAAETIRELMCSKDEVILHTHNEDCFDEFGTWICGMLEVTAHQHDEACFRQHIHSDSCYDETGSIICNAPVLICGKEEHTHTDTCLPESDDNTVDVTFTVAEEYTSCIESSSVFPITYTLEKESSINEIPVVTVISEDYLPDYHWVTTEGFPADFAAPVTEDTFLTLKLYPADEPEAAQTVTAAFIYNDEILLARQVNAGTIVSDIVDADTKQRLDELQTEYLHFSGWSYTDEAGNQQSVENGVTAITCDTVYNAEFTQYIPIALHDIDPDGQELSGSPQTILVPSGSSLAQQTDAVLGDGTAVSSCLWQTNDGTVVDMNAPITETAEYYTYSYHIELNMTPAEEEVEEEAQPTLFSLLRTTAAEEEASSDSESEIITIVKRSGDELTESDFIVDEVNYANYLWEDEDGNSVSVSDLVGTTLTANYAVTLAAGTDYTVTYNINIGNNVNVFGTRPTIGGGSTLTETYNTEDGSYTIRVPNPTSYMVASGNKKLLYQFTGWTYTITTTSGSSWRPGRPTTTTTTKTIAAGETVDAAWFADNDTNYTVTLTAQWTSVVVTETVHFFVNLNCQITDIDGNTEIPSAGDYTPSVFSTTMSVTGASMRNYWQGIILGGSQFVVMRADNAYDSASIDAELRRLINGHDSTNDTYNGQSVWKSGYNGTKIFQVNDFPSDEHVLSVVRDMVESGTVIRMDDVPIPAEDLTTENFTVRWNVCKYDTGDGWHIDGILVAKQAHMTVRKTFLGDDAAVQNVKNNGFTITVSNTSNSSAADLALTLNPASTETSSTHIGYSEYDANSDTYTWSVPLKQNNTYSIVENNHISTDDTIQTSASYTISNSPEAFTGWREYPDSGITGINAYSYASDISNIGYQTVALRNSYVKSDTLTINKIDMDTGNGLPGVSYRLTDAQGNDLTLYKKPDAAFYSMKPEDTAEGFVLQPDNVITTGNNGAIFLKLNNGTFTLEEAFPTGYGGASIITVTVSADSLGNIVFEDIKSTDSTIEVDGTLVDAHTATLTVRNVSQPTSVTANKVWLSESDAQEVTVALYRNGVALGSEYQAVLNEANNWTFTWNGLPLYADGSAAEYSLREIKIGSVNHDPSADNDGYAGYIVAYDPMVYYKDGEQVSSPTWIDDNGVTQYADNASLTVRNEVYRGQMVFMKVDGDGNPLPGATFRLYRDEAQTEVLAEATSDEYGRVIFENLVPDTYYVMKESGTPNGYLGADGLYKVRLSSRGTTSVEDNDSGEVLPAIVNYADEIEVQLYKVNELESALSGAQFLLEQLIDDQWTELGTYETASDGIIPLGTLGSGDYRLTESKAPDGYIPLDGPIEFTVQQAVVTAARTEDHWGISGNSYSDAYTITVINETGYELPQTGGATTRPYTYGGLLLILFTAALFGYKKRRRKEDNSS